MSKPTYEELAKAFDEAVEHLNYCGYGDSWERECAVAAGMPKRFDELKKRLTSTRANLEPGVKFFDSSTRRTHVCDYVSQAFVHLRDEPDLILSSGTGYGGIEVLLLGEG